MPSGFNKVAVYMLTDFNIFLALYMVFSTHRALFINAIA